MENEILVSLLTRNGLSRSQYSPKRFKKGLSRLIKDGYVRLERSQAIGSGTHRRTSSYLTPAGVQRAIQIMKMANPRPDPVDRPGRKMSRIQFKTDSYGYRTP